MNENEKAVTKRQAAEEAAAKKKKKYFWIKIGVLFCVIVGIALSVLESNFIYRKIEAADVNGTKYSVAEYNWFCTESYYEIYANIYNTYGSMASYVIDTSKPLSSQQYSETETWADYVKQYAKTSMQTVTALYNAGKEAGYVMDEETSARVDSELETVKETAKTNGTTLGSYLTAAYGRGVNESVFRDMYERYLYAYSYAESTASAEEITSADIDAYYAENKDSIDTVSYRYYYVSSSPATENNATPTDAEKLAAQETAKADAEAVLAAEDIDAFLAEKDSTMSEANYSLKASVNELYADWLFDGARVAGDRQMFDSSTGYYVIEFVEKNDLHYNTKTVRHILITPEDTTNDGSWQTAFADAQAILDEWKAGEATEDSFAALATEKTKDSGSAANGGLYANINKGQTVSEFEDWCFDESRKPGDTDMVKSSYGWHVMYFVGEGEDYYTSVITKSITNERYSDFVIESSEGSSLTELSGMKYAAKHL